MPWSTPPVRRAVAAAASVVLIAAAAAIGLAARRGRAVPAAFEGRIAPVLVSAAVAVPPPPPVEPPRCAPEPPLAARTPPSEGAAELARLVREDPARLGSASIGQPTRGALWGGVELLQSDDIARSGGNPWGTELVVRSIERAVRQVRRCHPDTPKLSVGDISREQGGWLLPHRSHQSGLDADLGYYYTTGPAWFVQATADNLDVVRTWALVRALLDGGDVELIFMDRRVQRLLREHADTLVDERGRLDDLFESENKKDTVIRHASGHGGHFHVRFRDPVSVEMGQRLASVVPRTVLARPAARAAGKARPAPAPSHPPRGKSPPKR